MFNLCTGSSVAEWAQDGESSSWLDQQRFNTELFHETRSLSLNQPSSARFTEPKPLYRTSSYPQQQLGESSNWLDQQIFDTESVQENKRWSSQPSIHFPESKPLHRTSSYPLPPQQHHHFSSEPAPPPVKSNFTSFPPPGGRIDQHVPQYHSVPSPTAGLQLPFSAPNHNFQLPGLPRGGHYGGSMSQITSPGLSFSNRPQKQWVNPGGLLNVDHASLLQSVLQQQSSVHLAQLYAPHSPSHRLMLGSGNGRDQIKPKPSHRGRHNSRSSQHGSDSGGSSQRSGDGSGGGGLVQFRSKHMTSEEIESILKMQHAATHGNDPYVDDYYHQARLAKRSTGSARSKHHFCPSVLKEQHHSRSRSNSSSEQQQSYHVDALGKVPIPTIRRPRALLEAGPVLADGSEQVSERPPLEKEPMLAARVMIEDGLSVLIDVEDIDRYLRRRRQILLETLASALQLVDPLGQSGKNPTMGQEDIVFLRLASMPKGRQLISKFLQLLIPGNNLVRIVSMAVFRHLRFLFGGVPSDPEAARTSVHLTKIVCSCISGMDLHALSACLVAVVCSSEQPPFRPLGSPAGDGASVVLKSVLSVYAKMPAGMEKDIDEDVHAATKREMPVELLRACLPHTNEKQMEFLRRFGQKRSSMTGLSIAPGSSGLVSSESVKS
ncbi:Protein PAT1 homolog 1 [Linum perenne]